MIKVLGSMDFEHFVITIENLPTDNGKKLPTAQKLQKKCRRPKWLVPKKTN